MVKPTVTAKIKSDPKRLDALAKRLRAAARLEVAVGFPATKDGLGQPWYDSGESIIDVAIANNYGTDEIPARPFMDLARPEMQRLFRDEMAKVSRRLATEDVNLEKVYNLLGAMCAEEVRKAIFDGGWAANSPATIKRKKSSRPLIDTGEMARRATWHVRPR